MTIGVEFYEKNYQKKKKAKEIINNRLNWTPKFGQRKKTRQSYDK